MALGFTKSKEDSNLFLRVEGEILVMHLLYVDDLFLIGKEEVLKVARRRIVVEFEMKDLGMMHYVLGMEVWTREVCSRDPEEVQDDGLQDHTYGVQPEAIECCFTKFG